MLTVSTQDNNKSLLKKLNRLKPHFDEFFLTAMTLCAETSLFPYYFSLFNLQVIHLLQDAVGLGALIIEIVWKNFFDGRNSITGRESPHLKSSKGWNDPLS